MNTDIQQILTDWGRWAKSGGVDVGYPHSTPFYRPSKSAGWGAKTPLIHDDMACRVDMAVAMLELRCRNRREDRRYTMLEGVYLKRIPVYQLAEKYRMDRRTASSALRAAESWVDSQVFIDELSIALVEQTMV